MTGNNYHIRKRKTGTSGRGIGIRMFISICLVFIVFGHLWQRIQVLVLGYKISSMELNKENLTEQHRDLWLELTSLRSFEKRQIFLESDTKLDRPAKVKIIEVAGSPEGTR